MTKRFNNLEAALNYLKTTDEGLNPDAPAGTPLRLYQDWKAGKRNISYVRSNASKPGDLKNVAVNPFGLALDGSSLTTVTLSARARVSGIGTALVTAGNITEAVPATAKKLSGYKPAKATVRLPTGSTATTKETSKLTGVKYAPSNTISYTFPYGKKVGELTESEVRAKITAEVNKTARAGVSYTSERL